jgi:hypothetical protein
MEYARVVSSLNFIRKIINDQMLRIFDDSWRRLAQIYNLNKS